MKAAALTLFLALVPAGNLLIQDAKPCPGEVKVFEITDLATPGTLWEVYPGVPLQWHVAPGSRHTYGEQTVCIVGDEMRPMSSWTRVHVQPKSHLVTWELSMSTTINVRSRWIFSDGFESGDLEGWR